jgi:hypothetical protein
LSLDSSFLSNMRCFNTCQCYISDNKCVDSLFLFFFSFIYLFQTSWNSVLSHITPAGHFGLDNINMDPRARKGYNLLVYLLPVLRVAHPQTVEAHGVVRCQDSHIFLDNWLTMIMMLSALCAGCPLPPGRFLVLISLRC